MAFTITAVVMQRLEQQGRMELRSELNRGMKLIQIWVPDPKCPYFAAEWRRQSRLLAESPHEKEDQAFIDSIFEWKPD